MLRSIDQSVRHRRTVQHAARAPGSVFGPMNILLIQERAGRGVRAYAISL